MRLHRRACHGARGPRAWGAGAGAVASESVKMKRFVLGAVALLATGATAEVRAADYPYPPAYPPPYAPPPRAYTVPQPLIDCSWAGPYLGGNLGYSWGSVGNNPAKPSGFAGGVQAGYNWQNGPWVFGVEGDIQATGADQTFAPWKFS